MAGPKYDEDGLIMKLVVSEVPIRMKKDPVIQDHCEDTSSGRSR